MKILSDFFPIILFFIAYKLAGIYVATAIAIGTAFFQVIYTRLRYGRWEWMQVITFILLLVLGSTTLLLHNELFIKWKPTIINWLFALFFLGSQFTKKGPAIRQLMQNHVELPASMWDRLNLTWVFFFFLIGLANLYVIYHFSTDTWVAFKLFGLLGLTLIFIVGQTFYLSRYMKHE